MVLMGVSIKEYTARIGSFSGMKCSREEKGVDGKKSVI
jgi:hypothetical protein